MPRLSSKERIRRFFRNHIGEVVTNHQLQKAVGPDVTEWARRVRELRSEEHWPIKTHNDDANLKPGEYLLTDDPPDSSGYKFAKHISGRLRAEVLERNGYTCQMCGAGAGDDDDQVPGRKVRLHVGHIKDRSHGGRDELTNLRALCSTCNQGAKNLVQEPPSWIWLLGQLRRASRDDQERALEWLKSKFGEGN